MAYPTIGNMNTLDREANIDLLDGKQLTAVLAEHGYVTFVFEDLVFSSLARPALFCYGVPLAFDQVLNGLIGQHVLCSDETYEQLSVTLTDGYLLVVPLNASDAPGPEMATLSGGGKFIAQWSRP